MSRSYKAPVIVQAPKPSARRDEKRWASKAVRRVPVTEALPIGGHYRRLYDSYDITEHTSYGYTDSLGVKRRFIIK
jgi:hypothetical protein